MPFEVFNRKSASRSKGPFLTIQKRGTISVNRAAVDLLMKDEPSPETVPVELVFDRERKIIGIQVAKDAVNPYYLRRMVRSDVYLLAGRLFVKHYGIATEIARRYTAKMYDGKVLGACLTDPHIEVGRDASEDDASTS